MAETNRDWDNLTVDLSNIKTVEELHAELKEAFEKSGRRHNSAEPEEVEALLTLTEKKIIQQCRRPKCNGCKLGWICPKYWSESQ